MLTPAEELGLAGAALDARVRRAVNHIPDSTLAHLERRLAADARINEVVYERDGIMEPIRIMLRPLLVMPDQVTYLHRVCSRIVDALKGVPQYWLEDPRLQSLFRFAPAEEAWIRDAWSSITRRGVNPLYARLDAVCDFTGARWQDSLQFLEANLSGVGGIQMGPLADSLVMRDVVPTLVACDPGLDIEPPRDQRDLFLQVLLDHARVIGRTGNNICLVEPKYVQEGPNEQSALARFLQERHGITVVHADPRELRLENDEVFYGDTRVDVAYRDYEVRDLLALEREDGRELAAMRALFRQNRMVSSIGGEFDHKACWELLTDEELAATYYSASERRMFRRHVLWTRVLSPRVTTLPDGSHGDLPEFAYKRREELVLKPNRGYGGTGIRIGSLTSAGEWDALIGEALRTHEDPNDSWVVQSVANLPVHEFPVVDESGRAHAEPFYGVMGFTPTDNGLAMLCRVSQKQVVNVAQHGGLAPMLIGHRPRDLRAPIRAAVAREQAQRQLAERIRRLRDLDAVISLLFWDEETYLPDGGRARRGAQLGTLESLRHELLVDDGLGDLIEEVAAHSGAKPASHSEIDQLRRQRRIALALPHDLVSAFAEARSAALAGWEHARRTEDFATFAGPFARLLGLVRERAQALQVTKDLYDGLIDEHEPGMTRARLDPLLRDLGQRLAPLVRSLAERTAGWGHGLPRTRYADALQAGFCESLLRDMGFDFRRGRLDRSTHPFTLMAGEDDVRVTIRVFEDAPLAAVFATLHEGGHALYDQGFPVELHGTLLAEAPGMGLHESQSRLWENHVGRSRGFWVHYFPQLQKLFPQALGAMDAAGFHRAVNIVRPGTNRVEADEVTYNLHILMRYEMETALLAGDLPVGDLPLSWAEQSRKWLGVVPGSLRDGCLQDVHWSLGSFGYFPTYTLGNLYAAQLIEAYQRAGHDLNAQLRAGRLQELRGWLAVNIYAAGCSEQAEDIIRRVTGRGLEAEAFFRLLVARFAEAAG